MSLHLKSDLVNSQSMVNSKGEGSTSVLEQFQYFVLLGTLQAKKWSQNSVWSMEKGIAFWGKSM